MDRDRWQHVRRLFDQALDHPPAGRTAFVQQACGGDTQLMAEVSALLATDEGTMTGGTAAPVADHAGVAGRRLGAFTLVRLLGSGGMGAVYEAVQDRPKRTVALKTLGLGFANDRAKVRFEDEVEILARLRHPHIAQVLEAGTLRDGGLELPYFAMELVEEPKPIDRHVREAALDLTQTVQLMQQVCDAVHFAHQRGVIHRDLKPQNVLVDKQGVVKVIDFGIARALDADSGRTLTGEVLGTLGYMSPERLEGAPGSGDTRADVYALGVILYELLAGQRPFQVDGMSLTAAVQLLRTREPERPSTLTAPQLPPELDWITLVAMAAEPQRRYPSASELAADLGRFLRQEPVTVGPPGTRYRLRKFVRRHRLPLAAAALLLVCLLTGTVIALSGWRQAAREAATLYQVNRMHQDILGGVYGRERGRDVKLADLLDEERKQLDARAIGNPEVEAGLRSSLGTSYMGLGLVDAAEEVFTRGWRLVEEGRLPRHGAHAVTLRHNLAMVHSERGDLARAEQELREVLADKLVVFGPSHDTAATHANLGNVLQNLGRTAECLEQYQKAYEIYLRLHGPDDLTTITAQTAMGASLGLLGRASEGEPLLDDAVARGTKAKGLGPEHPTTLAARSERCQLLVRTGRLPQAAAEARVVAEASERSHGPDHPRALFAFNNLAVILQKMGEFEPAEQVFRKLVAARERNGTRGSFDDLLTRHNAAGVTRRQKRAAEAEAELRALRAEAVTRLPKGHWLPAIMQKELGGCLRDLGERERAEQELLEAAAALESLGPADYRRQSVCRELADLYREWGKGEQAATWSERAGAPAAKTGS